jgi:hypothetical protein
MGKAYFCITQSRPTVAGCKVTPRFQPPPRDSLTGRRSHEPQPDTPTNSSFSGLQKDGKGIAMSDGIFPGGVIVGITRRPSATCLIAADHNFEKIHQLLSESITFQRLWI